MSAHATDHNAVETTLNYAGRIEGRPRFDVPNPARNNIAFEPATVIVHDARNCLDRLQLDAAGFAYVKHASRAALAPELFSDNMTYQPTATAATVKYEQEVAGFLQQLTGAHTVIPQHGGTLARTSNRARRKSWATPASFVHLDFTADSAQKFLNWSLSREQRDMLRYRRFAIYQTWRALSRGPQDNTLAVCDGSSVPPQDAVIFDSVIGPEDQPGAKFESRICKFRASHRWYYLCGMEPEDLLVFKGFDSEVPQAMNAMHTAFDNPLAGDDAEARRSVESRFFAFFS